MKTMLTRLPAGTFPPNLLLTDASGRQFIHPDTSKRVNGKYRKKTESTFAEMHL
ncbi:MAG: hypothetical protein KF704_02010 [Crocinitomicaceae bacterium]|nr:hypothetical protein [Crocinitomicaceae bacterium]